MGISISNMVSAAIYSGNNNNIRDSRKTTDKQSSLPQPGQGSVYADQKEETENKEMLMQMNMSQTKLEAMGDYLGAMQKALKDSGNDGIMAYRRTSNLIQNGTEYMNTSDYKSKENSKCVVKDMTDSMKESQEALKKKAEKKKKDKKAEEKEDAGQTEKEEKPVIIIKEKPEEAPEVIEKEKKTKAYQAGRTVDILL